VIAVNHRCSIALALSLAVGIGVVALTHVGRPPSLDPSHTRTVVDSTGQIVPIPANPQRLLSLCTTVTDTILRLEQGHRLAGIDEYSRVVPGADPFPVLGKGSALSREQILARDIDLALIWWYQDEVAHLLADLGVPFVRIRCQRAAELPATLRLIGECLDVRPAAEALAVSLEPHLVRSGSPESTSPRVYLELYSPFKTAGSDSYLGDLLELAGARNVAGEARGALLLSAESLLEADPDIVLLIRDFAAAASFRQRTGMSRLRAVQSNRVHLLDRYVLVAGAGLPDAVRQLESLFAACPPPDLRHALP
jgi:iron complex transport system substrate-binding protein